MQTSAFLDYLRKLPIYQDQIVHREYIPPREAQHQQLEKPLQPAIQAALEVLHLFPLYSHQVATLDAARSGKNVILSTPSASGKTLGYNLAVLDSLLEEKGSRALCLVPL
ncbi:MAG: hypothetical protein DDT24_00289 [Chloroflexi bacterium]|nr:hypothetical protein [Chloroflexota bacterium]